MALPLVCALQPTDGARKQLRDGAERNAQRVGDLAIPQPIVAQMETLALAFRERIEHAPQAMSTLAIYETPFGIGIRIDHEERRLEIALKVGGFAPQSSASLEGDVVRDAEEPTLKI
jgi:hypothetical protein